MPKILVNRCRHSAIAFGVVPKAYRQSCSDRVTERITEIVLITGLSLSSDLEFWKGFIYLLLGSNLANMRGMTKKDIKTHRNNIKTDSNCYLMDVK